MLLKHSHLITLVLILSTKLMLFSITFNNIIIYLITIIISLILIFSHRSRIKLKKTNFLGLIVLTLSTLMFSFSKINNDVSLMNFIIPINIMTVLMAYISISYKPSTLKDSLLAYSNIISYILLVGLVCYIALTLNIITPTDIIHANDHADERGYFSFYGLVYYPSWISTNIAGITFYRFASIFWEPGTLGLYLIFLISIELTNLTNKSAKYKIGLYIICGILSLSLLFIFCLTTLFLSYLLSRKISKSISKNKLFITFMITIFSLVIIFVSYDFLYQLVFYRLDFDPSRGFVGNTRSGSLSIFWNQFNEGNILQQLFGFGPYSEFDGETTSIFLKLYQRGILGFTLFFLSICFFAKNTINKYFYLSWIIGLLILTQIEGAILFIILMLIQTNKTQNNESQFIEK